MLTEGQIACFRTFGFVLLRQLFNRDEQQAISDEYERGLKFARAGVPDWASAASSTGPIWDPGPPSWLPCPKTRGSGIKPPSSLARLIQIAPRSLPAIRR